MKPCTQALVALAPALVATDVKSTAATANSRQESETSNEDDEGTLGTNGNVCCFLY